ncbi:MAG: DUF6263 family protein [Planctomycetia bacterium]|nr:DUF6263 family protein [Planctomycetia bacterium]
MMGKTTTRSRTAWRALGAAVASAVAFTLAAATAPARAAAPALSWKFTEGDALHYQMDQKTVTQVKGPNQDIKTTVTQTIDTTWSVGSVDKGSGDATMTQTIDRVRTRIEFPFGAFDYDSKSDKAPEGPLAAGIVPTLKALVGARFQYKMSPQGELSDIQVPATLLKALKEAGPATSNVGMSSEDGLKNMINESSLILPRDAEKGKPWNRKTRIPSPPVGTMLLDKTYTYTGTDPEGEKITLDVKVNLEPDPKSNVDIKLGNQEGKGTFHFDSKAGRVVNSTVSEKIEMVIKVMNADLNQSTDMSTTMKLLDPRGGETK